MIKIIKKYFLNKNNKVINYYYLVLLFIYLVFNIITMFNLNLLFFIIYKLLFLLLFPGLIIMLIFNTNGIKFFEYIVYIIGISISFLMFTGLTINWLFLWLHITEKPLSLFPLLISFDVILLIFGIIAYKRNKELTFKITIPKLNWLNKTFFLIQIIFPTLSIFGSTTLNNGGTNNITTVMLVGIAIYIFIIILISQKINKYIYPSATIAFAISILIMFSLRSWHILGWDINQEYLVFILTKNLQAWSIHTLNSSYNLCLSITILPMILNTFININSEYIFKLIFPILFSIVPLIIYLISNKFIEEKYAFLSAFFFISQYWFFEAMPALARQEIAFIFLGSILLLILNENLSKRVNNLLLIIFGISIPVSHYSTAYIWLATIFIFYIINRILKITILNKIEPCFSLKYLLLMLSFTFIWVFQINSVPNNFKTVLSDVVVNISNIFSSTSISTELNTLALSNLDVNNDRNVNYNYISLSKLYSQHVFNLFPDATFRSYKPVAVYPEKINTKVSSGIVAYTEIILKIIKLILIDIFPIIGFCYLLNKFLFKNIKNNKIKLHNNIKINYILISASILPLMALIVILHLIQTEYNLSRFYLQGLISFSFMTIIGGKCLLTKLRLTKVIDISLALILLVFFFSTTGLIIQFVGGEPQVNLNNFGEEYDRYYITQSETSGANWLKNNYNKKDIVYADEMAFLRLTSFGLMTKFNPNILPSTITKNSYVYLSSTNIFKGKVYKRFDIDFLSYNSPVNFIAKNKDLIYNNGGSKIFK